MADKKTPMEILEGQQLKPDPKMQVMVGLYVHLWNTINLLQEFNSISAEEGAGEVEEFTAQINEALGFFSGMEEAGLYTKHILKVQVPLSSNDPNPPCLVYNEDKSITTFVSMDEQVLMMCGDRPKVYVEANLWSDGTLQILRDVGEQEW